MINYVQCTNNQGYEVSLTRNAIYKVLTDSSDQSSLRVIDNEGEDYLYDKSRFDPISLDHMHGKASDAVTVHLAPIIKGILHAEALAQQMSVSALLRSWIDQRLDLPEPL